MTARQRASEKAAEEKLELVLADSENSQQVAAELFNLADLLSGQPALLRSLTNPGRSTQDRTDLVQGLVQETYLPESCEVIRWLVGQHWSKPERLVKAVEAAGVFANLIGARSRNELAQVGTELFEVRRLIANERDLRIQLSTLSSGNTAQRVELMRSLLSTSVLPSTAELVLRAVKIAQHGHLQRLLREYGQLAARFAGTHLVTVKAARPFSDTQRDRLRTLLERQVGKPVIMAVTVDPRLIGGFRVNYGEDAADSSIRTEIGEARRALVR